MRPEGEVMVWLIFIVAVLALLHQADIPTLVRNQEQKKQNQAEAAARPKEYLAATGADLGDLAAAHMMDAEQGSRSFRNLLMPYRGETVRIPVLYISTHGVFVVQNIFSNDMRAAEADDLDRFIGLVRRARNAAANCLQVPVSCVLLVQCGEIACPMPRDITAVRSVGELDTLFRGMRTRPALLTLEARDFLSQKAASYRPEPQALYDELLDERARREEEREAEVVSRIEAEEEQIRVDLAKKRQMEKIRAKEAAKRDREAAARAEKVAAEQIAQERAGKISEDGSAS